MASFSSECWPIISILAVVVPSNEVRPSVPARSASQAPANSAACRGLHYSRTPSRKLPASVSPEVGCHGCLSGVQRGQSMRICPGGFPVRPLSLRHRFGAVAAPGGLRASAFSGLLPQSEFGSPSGKCSPCLGSSAHSRPPGDVCPERTGQKRRNTMFQNRVTVIGFLGKDAEKRATKNDIPYTILRWRPRNPGRTAPANGSRAQSGTAASSGAPSLRTSRRPSRRARTSRWKASCGAANTRRTA